MPEGTATSAATGPSTFFLLEALTPASLGALLALHEHRVFTSGSVWGIDSFDQWGVELGKVLASDIAKRLASGDTQGLDPSTRRLCSASRDPQACEREGASQRVGNSTGAKRFTLRERCHVVQSGMRIISAFGTC
jgi:hypothetical protein